MGTSEKAFNNIMEIFKYRDLYVKPALWGMRIPLVAKLIGLLPKPPGMDLVQLTYLPVTENIEVPPGSAVPASIMEHFIKEASYHVILNECICRTTKDCKDYPVDLGCLFMGEGARDINPAYSRHVGEEEALEHFHRSVEAGLTPAIGRFIGDALALGIKNHGRMMTVCHCCPCCCISQYLGDMPEQAKGLTSRAIVPLEGVKVIINDNCVGCGLCEKTCPFGMVRIVDGKARLSEHCLGCGRCTTVCKKDAIEIRIEDPEYINQAVKRIKGAVNVGI
ncbi:MAG: 4Fe-4S binding protein [Actinobacteria bacterium]|nr:4Fe-4S binding protein [Actinomycetota bacterium]